MKSKQEILLDAENVVTELCTRREQKDVSFKYSQIACLLGSFLILNQFIGPPRSVLLTQIGNSFFTSPSIR